MTHDDHIDCDNQLNEAEDRILQLQAQLATAKEVLDSANHDYEELLKERTDYVGENKRLSDVCVKHGFTISELHTRIDKMTVNDIDPETRLSGYKWLTNSLKQRRNELRDELNKHCWIPTEDGPPKNVDWKQVVEAIEDCAKVPVFVTMEQIFMDEGSEFTHWRPITLPEGE